MIWKIKNTGGFTMVEMLIVLSAFLMLSATSVFLFTPHNDVLAKELFFTQLESDLLYSQQYAISHQEQITVQFIPENHHYFIRGSNYGSPYLVDRYYSPEVSVEQGTMKLLFHYMPDGNIDSFGSLYVTAGSKKFRMMIQIGKGRFYVVEE
ncbi:type II secretion system protein [Bacillus sp. ISL-35]|uniref:competence type IV pilus minor pilin ComGD n=1 Tax=Bacillus sp. ISL-35 TaxID=2819122 RepID=UPI001BE523B3|nr:competence type IV pilus minor pilin ComGD [Bacillus sp. ISL-35]MBT2677523.1 type II secretion system protein [Bacillus sp. ISL-35]MBT2702089.1 type II secretion system protein [Chryseobacterium sp. ISL-80]